MLPNHPETYAPGSFLDEINHAIQTQSVFVNGHRVGGSSKDSISGYFKLEPRISKVMLGNKVRLVEAQ